jgi:hypothetical protein
MYELDKTLAFGKSEIASPRSNAFFRDDFFVSSYATIHCCKQIQFVNEVYTLQRISK